MKKFAIMTLVVTGILGFMVSSANAGYYSTKLELRENRLEMKLNRVHFEQEYVGTISDTASSLSDEQVQELQEIKEDFETEMLYFENSITAGMSLYEREEVYSEMKETIARYYGMMLVVVGGNYEAEALIEDRYELFQTNEELREENRKTIQEYINDMREIFEELEV